MSKEYDSNGNIIYLRRVNYPSAGQKFVFNNPAPKREGFKVLPKLEQVTDEQRVASGKLVIKVLPHKPSKLEVTFPIMTEQQYRAYFNAIDGMYLDLEFYNENTDSYKRGTFYHTDISYTPVKYGGEEMIQFDTIKFIEH